MDTIRSRAIELANDRKYFASSRSNLRRFENAGDAKLEADAHLAIVINQIVHQLVASKKHEQRFVAQARQSVELRNRDPESVVSAFPGLFGGVYDDFDLIRRTFHETKVGQKALQASHAYAETASLWWTDGNIHAARRIMPNSAYLEPVSLVGAGIRNVSRRMGRVLWGVNMSEGARDMDAEARQALIGSSGLDLLKMGALSLYQHGQYETADPVIESGRLRIAPDIEIARAMPLYSKAFPEGVRPHRGCPAMPNLPATMLISGGSSIQMLHERASGLIVATNMHTLSIPQEALGVAA